MIIKTFEEQIRDLFKIRAHEIITEEITKAQNRVAERLANISDEIVLSTLSEYSIRDNRNKLIIEVKKR